MAFEIKDYLNYEGLEAYDANIKGYFQNSVSSVQTALKTAIDQEVDDRKAAIETVETAIEEVKALVGEESVQQVVDAAISKVVAGAPEAFDTLKEIADWIEEHGEGATALIQSVQKLSERVDTVDAKVDAVYASFQPISTNDIKALFLEAVSLKEGQTIEQALNDLNENEKLVLTDDVNTAVAIAEDAVIEAKGVVFNEPVTVSKDAQVSIIGAQFTKPFIIA